MATYALLLINSIGYLVLGLWCAVAPHQTAAMIGLGLVSPQGLAEYVAVYGGLEVGLGAFFMLCLAPHRRALGVLFSLCLYSGLVLFRSAAIISYEATPAGIGWLLYGLEITLLAWSILLIRAGQPKI